MRVKPSSQLTLHDKLSRLTFVQAQKLLGAQGAHWLAMGGKIEIDTATQVRLTDESCQISFPEADAAIGDKSKVYLMITENTIEENLLATLSAKHELAAAVLDPDSELREVNLASGIEELKRRLEALLGAKPEGASDESMRERTEADAIALAQRKERVAEAGGQLLAAAFSFLGEILPAGGTKAPAPQAVAALTAGLAQCVETTQDGKLRLAVTLPGMQSLDALAAALAKLMAAREGGTAGEAGAA